MADEIVTRRQLLKWHQQHEQWAKDGDWNWVQGISLIRLFRKNHMTQINETIAWLEEVNRKHLEYDENDSLRTDEKGAPIFKEGYVLKDFIDAADAILTQKIRFKI